MTATIASSDATHDPGADVNRAPIPKPGNDAQDPWAGFRPQGAFGASQPLELDHRGPTLHSHIARTQETRQPDEAPVDWRPHVSLRDPGTTLHVQEVQVGRIPDPPNPHGTKFDANARELYWSTYAGEVQKTDVQQQAIAGDYAAFMDATRSPDLRALGFLLPSADWRGDVASLTEQQEVVAGQHMGTLFRPGGSLDMTHAENLAAADAGRAATAGGAAKPAHDKIVEADNQLQGKYDGLTAAIAGVRAAQLHVQKNETDVTNVGLAHRVDADKRHLATAQGAQQAGRGAADFLSGGLLKYALAGSPVDAIESLGTMASYLLGVVSDHAIDAAEARLQADTQKLNAGQDQAAAVALAEAKANGLKTLALLRQARNEVLVALSQRQAAYAQAGNISAGACGCDPASQTKIAGAMAAIPAVELVLGLARNLADKASTGAAAYSELAGAGFHMAVFDNQPSSGPFVTALSQIEFIKVRFRQIASQWNTRLASLRNFQTTLGGTRPRE